MNVGRSLNYEGEAWIKGVLKAKLRTRADKNKTKLKLIFFYAPVYLLTFGEEVKHSCGPPSCLSYFGWGMPFGSIFSSRYGIPANIISPSRNGEVEDEETQRKLKISEYS